MVKNFDDFSENIDVVSSHLTSNLINHHFLNFAERLFEEKESLNVKNWFLNGFSRLIGYFFDYENEFEIDSFYHFLIE